MEVARRLKVQVAFLEVRSGNRGRRVTKRPVLRQLRAVRLLFRPQEDAVVMSRTLGEQ